MTLAQARDIAIVILALQGILAGIVPLIALYYALIGLGALRKKFLAYVPRGRALFGVVARRTERVSQALTEPLIRIETKKATWQGLARAAHKDKRGAI